MATSDGRPTHSQLIAWIGRLKADTARIAREQADVVAAVRETLAASAELLAACRRTSREDETGTDYRNSSPEVGGLIR